MRHQGGGGFRGMPSSVIAFSPGHISGYFCRVAKERIDQTGSIGAGIVLGLGVVATVAEADEIDVIISAGGVQVSGSPPVMAALKKLNVTASVKTASNLPLGSGFGLSAASLLAVLVAADELFSLSMGIETIAAIAHEIEVIYGNGLGDVAAECEGGLACRTAPGIAGVTSRIHGIRDRSLSSQPALSPPGRCSQRQRRWIGYRHHIPAGAQKTWMILFTSHGRLPSHPG